MHIRLGSYRFDKFWFPQDYVNVCCDVWVRGPFLHRRYSLVILTLEIISVEVVETLVITTVLVNSPSSWQGCPYPDVCTNFVPRSLTLLFQREPRSTRLMIALSKLVPNSHPPELARSSNIISSPGQLLKYWEKCNLGAKSGSFLNFSGSSSVTLC